MHLASLVDVGTTVKVVKSWPKAGTGVVSAEKTESAS